MSAQAAEKYMYKDLPSGSSIRLVQKLVLREEELHFSLETVDLNNGPVYSALSYTWGSSRKGDGLTPALDCKAFCNGQVVYITRNLLQFLTAIAGDQFWEPLWIDALSINQNDMSERTMQVGIMGSIYEIASLVIVWLGDSDAWSECALTVIRDTAPRILKTWNEPERRDVTFWQKIGRPEFTKHEWKSVLHFFRRNWFSRAWTIQEIVLAQCPLAFCGSSKQVLDWTEIATFAIGMVVEGVFEQLEHKYIALPEVTDQEQGVAIFQPFNTHMILQGSIRGKEPMGEGQTIPLERLEGKNLQKGFYEIWAYLINYSRSSHSTLPQDKIYAPLALAKQRLMMVFDTEESWATFDDEFPIPRADYSRSVSELYTETSKRLIETTGNLNLLSKVEDKSCRIQSGLPSWVPDFSFTNPRSLRSSRIGNKLDALNGCGDLAVYKAHFVNDNLHVCGLWYDTISSLGPGTPERYISVSPSIYFWFCLLLDKKVHGEDREIAFMRTLVGDDFPGSLADLRASFKAFLLVCCVDSKDAVPVARARILQHQLGLGGSSIDALNEVEKWPVLDRFQSEANETMFPSSKEVFFHVNSMAKAAADGEFGTESCKKLRLLSQPYETACEKKLMWNRLVRTSKGHIGLCPISTKVGDSIWLISGSKNPYILRDASTTGVYEYMGEAYIHGIMNGEMFHDGSDQLNEFQEVILC